jgi:tetratricopeptide (TPR) repeat protein
MSEVEQRLSSALSAVRSYLEAKLVKDAVVAAEKAVEIAHELGRDHPRYVEAARIAALAYGLAENPGMATRYLRQAAASAEKQHDYPQERLGSLRFELARAELDRGNQAEAAAELDRAIPLLQSDRDKRDAEARQAMFLRVALCMISGDAKDEVDTHVARLRDWLAPVFADEAEGSADKRALAEHEMVTALASSARLKVAQGRHEAAEKALVEAFERAERHMVGAVRPNPHLLGLVSEIYKELRRATKHQGAEASTEIRAALRASAERAERLFWAELRVVVADAQKTHGWTDAAVARKIEPVLHDGKLAADLGRHPLLHGMAEVLGRNAAKGTHLRDKGPDELRHVMRGDKPLASALDVMESAGLLDI